MLLSYLKIAWRHLVRNRSYTLLNGLGLTLGLGTAALVLLFLHYETGYDTAFSDADRIYRFNQQYRTSWYSTIGFPGYRNETPEDQLLLPQSLSDLPEVAAAAEVFFQPDAEYVYSEGKRVVLDNFVVTNTGSALQEVFGFEFLTGDPGELAGPGAALLTRPAAERLYGPGVDPVGKLLRRDSTEFRVAGVIAPLPSNTHFGLSVLLTQPRIPHWGAYHYLKLAPHADPAAVTAQLSAAYRPVHPRRLEDPLHGGFRLQPLTDIHLYSDTLYEIQSPGNPLYLYLCGAIGILILLITGINYTNLTIALYTKRRTEIGVRKTVGAQRGQLLGQFLTESTLLSLLCLLPALGWVSFLLPAFNGVMGTDLELFTLGREPLLGGTLVGITLLTGVLAGMYPGLLLSGQRILRLFERLLSGGSRGGVSVRQGLMLAQFVLMIALGSLAWLIYRQMSYVNNFALGFPSEEVLILNNIDGLASVADYQRFRRELLADPAVAEIGYGYAPGRDFNRVTYRLEDQEQVYDNANEIYCELSYLRVLGYDIDEQALFGPSPAPDASRFFVNQETAEQLELENPVGRVLLREPEDGGYPATIAGVLPNLNFFSLKQEVRPLFFEVQHSIGFVPESVLLRFETSQLPGLLQRLEATWRAAVPGEPFDYEFLDRRIAAAYTNEVRISRLSTGLSVMAFLLAALGLIGLTAFLTRARFREIGIRKVFGASPRQIIQLMSREFIILVLLATLLAVPFTVFVLRRYLREFAYAQSPAWWVFGAVGGGALLLAVVIVVWQSWWAAAGSPARGLRND